MRPQQLIMDTNFADERTRQAAENLSGFFAALAAWALPEPQALREQEVPA